MASPLDALIRIEEPGRKSITSPPSVLRRDEYAGSRAPSAYELEQINRNGRGENSADVFVPGPDPSSAASETLQGNQDIESRPGSPSASSIAHIVPSLNNPPRNKWRFIAVCVSYFSQGLNDSSIGALIPSIEAHYNISYGIVSLIFVANAIGFVAAATFTNQLEKRIGRAWHLATACVLMIAGYSILVASPPFVLLCIAFFLTGVGAALALAINNVFISNMTNGTTLLGVSNGLYGVGGTVGPILATVMTDSGVSWAHFFAILLAVSAINLFANFWTSLGYESDRPSHLLSTARRRHGSQSIRSPAELVPLDPASGDQPAENSQGVTAKPKASWRQILSSTTVYATAFIFTYQGAEVSISGWVLSFLLAYRAPPYESSAVPQGKTGYDPLAEGASAHTGSIGYVTSGFWAGLTLARLLATDRLAKFPGHKTSVAILVALCGAFQLLVWLIPNLIAESVVIAVLGVLLGPIYPLSAAIISRYLDRKVQTTSLAIIFAGGSSGGALAPFLVGIISQGAGVWVLHPICLAMYAIMGVCWFALNRGRGKRSV